MKPFPEIRVAMMCAGETQRQLALAMGKGASYVSDRFTGKASWTIEEGYWLLARYGIDHSRFLEVFKPADAATAFKPYAGQREKKRRLHILSGKMLAAR